MGLANSSPAGIATKRRFASSLNLIVTPRLLRPGAEPPPVPDSVFCLVLAVDSARLPCGHDGFPLISLMDRNPEDRKAPRSEPVDSGRAPHKLEPSPGRRAFWSGE